MPKRQLYHEEESLNRWLISYADFITLLFAFFVVMYSISQVNQEKYKVLSNTLKNVFKSSSLVFQASNTDGTHLMAHQLGKNDPLSSVDPGSVPAYLSDMARYRQVMQEALKPLIEQGLINVTGNETWVELSLQGGILFKPNKALLVATSLPVLDQIIKFLNTNHNAFRIEVHAKSDEIFSYQYYSSWELSAARAIAIARLMIDSGIADHRMVTIGHGARFPQISQGQDYVSFVIGQSKSIIDPLNKQPLAGPVALQASFVNPLFPRVFHIKDNVAPLPLDSMNLEYKAVPERGVNLQSSADAQQNELGVTITEQGIKISND